MENSIRDRFRHGIVFILLLALLAACSDTRARSTTPAIPNATVQAAIVKRVVDGDTIVVQVDGRTERVRYIGIDTPETVKPDTPEECFGKRATEENERLVGGKTVYLQRDVSERDAYDRLLRYVYVDDPQTGQRVFVNLVLVEGGFATSVTYPPDVAHEEDFRAAQRAARDAGAGLWSACPTGFSR